MITQVLVESYKLRRNNNKFSVQLIWMLLQKRIRHNRNLEHHLVNSSKLPLSQWVVNQILIQLWASLLPLSKSLYPSLKLSNNHRVSHKDLHRLDNNSSLAIPIQLVLEFLGNQVANHKAEYSAHRITNKAFLVSQEEAYLDNQQVRIQ